LLQDDIIVGNDLRQAAFRAYASLCANSEEVRKKVSSTSFGGTLHLQTIP